MSTKHLARFAVAGLFVTALSAMIYWSLATWLMIDALLSNFIGYAMSVVVGFFIHGRWTFSGSSATGRRVGAFARYTAGSVVGLAINSMWVWLFVSHLGLPKTAPIFGMVFITPLLAFYLNKKWVFK